MMEKIAKTSKKIQLVFPRFKEFDVLLPEDLSQYKDKRFFDLFATDVDELLNWFQGYRVESIELFVNGIIHSQDKTKLIIGGERDQKGVKFLLKPEEKIAVDPQISKSQDGGNR
jgi:hypothetical protein